MNDSVHALAESALELLGGMTQFLTGAGVGLTAGAVLGFVLSEWVKHKFRKAQQTQKAELDALLEQKKLEFAQVLESSKFAFAQELETFKETIKLQNSFKAGIAQGLSKGASEEIARVMRALEVADSKLSLAFYDALGGVPNVAEKLGAFDADLHACGMIALSPVSSTIPKDLVEAFSGYCLFLYTSGGLLRISIKTGAPELNELYACFNSDKIERMNHIRTLLHTSA